MGDATNWGTVLRRERNVRHAAGKPVMGKELTRILGWLGGGFGEAAKVKPMSAIKGTR